MKLLAENRPLLSFFFGVVVLAPSKANGQSIWDDYGTIPYDGDCTKVGYPALPGFEDPWVFNAHCVTYSGTVGCFDAKCVCNQGEDAYFDGTYCVGKVGAICSAEHSNLFPDKLCTNNADCVPIAINGTSRAIGKCQCLFGYKADSEGKCVVDDDIGEGQRSTPRTTTTTEPAERADFKLPALNLLIGANFVPFQQECHSKALLNRTYCDTHSGTVSCRDKKCQCNMKEDSEFDEELNQCVGLVGTYCLGRGYIMGYKACTKYADCVLEDGRTLDEGYSFGVCQCVYGYKETDEKDGTCERDETIPEDQVSSTQRIVPTPTTTKASTDGVTPAPGSAAIPSAGYGINILFAAIFVVYQTISKL